ncbi:MAG: S49 family peptidase [Proteobacteria bacterium]|nr:MAG: S49 family peptidase [Pseudomonadota bacterium]
MVDNPKIKSIVLNIDSPGGEANGCSELSEHIFAARKVKPIAAYIGGQGASAAYWLASACAKIYASETAFVGSIGVQSVVKPSKASDKITFVSSLSPNKNRDPSTDEGAREIQNVVDSLGKVFVEKVAAYRGLSTKEVLSSFGQGSVFIAGEALKRGMIDEISTLEGVIGKLQTKEIEEHSKEPTLNRKTLEEKTVLDHTSVIQFKTEAVEQATTERILAIQRLAAGRVSPEFTEKLILEKITVDQAALRILQASEADRLTSLSSFQDRENALSELSGKPLAQEQDDFESTLRFAQSHGLVSLL